MDELEVVFCFLAGTDDEEDADSFCFLAGTEGMVAGE